MDARGRIATLALAAIAAAAGVPREAGAEDSPGGKPVTEFFRGKVLRANAKGDIEIRYDFEDPQQMADFETVMPYRAILSAQPAWESGAVRLKGTGSFRHVAVFDTTIGLEAQLTPARPRDFGFAVTESRESEVFTLYCVQDTYFSLGDGVRHPQNMVIKFIPRDPRINKDGMQDWRYCGSRGQEPEIQRNVPLHVRIARGDNESEMWLLDWHSQGKEAGRDLSSQMGAVYVHDSDVKIDDLVIRGRLSAAFVERHGLDLSVTIEPDEPATTEPGPVEIDPAVAEKVREQIAGYPLATSPAAMAKLLRDAAVPDTLRREALERVVGLGNKRIVPFVVDGLYADDTLSRELSLEVVRALVGKTFGYRPDADDEKRRKAISSLNEYIAKNRRQFE